MASKTARTELHPTPDTWGVPGGGGGEASPLHPSPIKEEIINASMVCRSRKQGILVQILVGHDNFSASFSLDLTVCSTVKNNFKKPDNACPK